MSLWQIKISMEYPLRPPFFTLNLYTMNSEEKLDESEDSNWYNELRAMEAEVRRKFILISPYTPHCHCSSCLYKLDIKVTDGKGSFHVVDSYLILKIAVCVG